MNFAGDPQIDGETNFDNTNKKIVATVNIRNIILLWLSKDH